MRRLALVLFGGLCLACGGLGRDPAREASVTPVTRDDGVTVLADLGTSGDRLALAGEELLIGAFDGSAGWVLAVPKAGGPARLVGWVPRVLKGLETDGVHAWVATWGGLYRLDLATGDKQRIGERDTLHALALNDTHVAWMARSGVWVQALPDGTPTLLHSTLVTQGSIGLYGSDVFFAYHEGLFRIPLAGGTPERLAEHASPNAGARMAVVGERLLIDLGVGGPTFVPLAGGAQVDACSGVRDHRRGMAATEQGLYWGAHEVHFGAIDNRRSTEEWHRYTPGRQKAGSAGGVYYCPFDGASSTTNLAPDTTDVLDIVVDDTHVYWVDKWSGTVGKSKRD